jgi:hypothetical protein
LRGLQRSVALGAVKRIGRYVIVLVIATALGAAGCSSPPPPTNPPVTGTTTPATNGTSTSSGRPSTSPSASAQALVEFSTDGAGPYQLGLTLTQLKAKPGLDEVTTGGVCPNNTYARGVGVWRDVRMSFRQDGQLYLLVNRSDQIPTPSGAWLGTTLVDLKKIYAGLVNQDLTRGTNSAFLVQTLSGGGILFELDPAKKVMSMMAGDAAFLRTSFNGGTNFC